MQSGQEPQGGMQASTGDLALGLARLEGKLDALTQTTTLQLNAFQAAISESNQDRRDLHREVQALKLWRSWLTGFLAAASLLASYAALHQAGIIH